MKTEQQIRERIIQILEIKGRSEFDMPITEVRKWLSYLLMWVLNEIEGDTLGFYCQIHRQSYLGEKATGCEVCQVVIKQRQKLEENKVKYDKAWDETHYTPTSLEA